MDKIFAFCAILVFIGCQAPEEQAADKMGPYFGAIPTENPQLLAPDVIACSMDTYNGTFNPEGTEFFYTLNTPREGIIAQVVMNEDGSWSDPIVANFSGEYSEYDPLFSPDGQALYFSSERPTGDSTLDNRTNIWKVNRLKNGWSEPELVRLTGNGDYHSSIANDGDIYFNVWSNGDLFHAEKTDSSYAIHRLPDVINSTNGEGDPFVAPDESYIIYRGYNNTLGAGDLYITFKTDTSWTEPQNLGEPINSDRHEMCPYVTSDGKLFIFASARMQDNYTPKSGESLASVEAKHHTHDNGQLNVYSISASFIEDLRP